MYKRLFNFSPYVPIVIQRFSMPIIWANIISVKKVRYYHCGGAVISKECYKYEIDENEGANVI